MMPGQKSLPSDDWKNNQLVPSSQNNNAVARRSSTQRHGMPLTERHSKYQMDSEQEPPPMFTAQPNKMSIRRAREGQRQKHIYRVDNGIDPVVLLTDRLEVWRNAIKNLVSYYKKLVTVENKSAKDYLSASKEITLPFPKSNGQFIETGAGGIQDVWGSLRDYTLQHGMLHHESASYTEKAVIPALRAIKHDIKTMITSIQKDKNLRTSIIFESRMQVDRMIAHLDKVIEHVYRAPSQADQNTDPFLLNLGIIHAIRELCDHENQLHDNILSLQKETGLFEQKTIENVRYVLSKLREYRLKHKMESPEYIDAVVENFNELKPSDEWNEFIRRHQYNLLRETSAYKTEDMVDYPNKESKYVRATKIGPLELKSGAIRRWTEGVYIITPAGFLHGYKTPKQFQTSPLRPSFSVFVPNLNIEEYEDDDIFELRGDGRRTSVGLGTRYVFRARNSREAQEWLDALHQITDQFEPMPLLANEPFNTTHFGAPVQRDLPPLPESTLPLPGDRNKRKEKMRAIESGPSTSNGVGINGGRDLGTVNEEENGYEKPLPHPSATTGTEQGRGMFAGEHQQYQLADPGTPISPAILPKAMGSKKFDQRPIEEQKNLPMMQLDQDRSLQT
ncbi:hypothetical protein EDC96DRAFT_473810 [Choanephora cucurbitarum]|nr:hypothetical protein EDC96DRAFT_473810 [Choanephora cucurbitarum]